MTRHAIVAAVLLAFAPRALPLDLGDARVSLNGFGEWAFGVTTANTYTMGEPRGRFANTSFAAAITAQPSNRLSVAAQIFTTTRLEAPGAAERHDLALDWAFASWRLSDALAVRAGKLKLPAGISGELVDVGVLRPFLSLPSSIYGSGILAEAFEGVEVTGVLPVGKSILSYDAFFGEMETSALATLERVSHPERLDPDAKLERLERQTPYQGGGRLVLATPVDGLSFRVSAFTGKLEETGEADALRVVVGLSAEYATDRWSLRSEWFHQRDAGILVADGAYVEAARFLGEHLQLAVRADVYRARHDGVPSRSSPFQHRELSLGANWWISHQLVVKAAYHDVYGNAFAAPALFDAAVLSGTLEPRTRLLEAGIQFAF